MLSPQENKVVISTLTKRRAWLRKTLEDAKLDTAQRTEFKESLELLESAMQKLAAIEKLEASSTAASSPPPKSAPRSPLTINTARVLIAEDNKESAELLVVMLEDMGIKHVDVAKDGRNAFDKIKSAKEPYDIIFCDWDMPELSGIQVHQKAKASNTLRGAHFCMVTGVTEAKKIREAIQQGVNDYVVKPVDGNILEDKIKAAIKAKAEA